MTRNDPSLIPLNLPFVSSESAGSINDGKAGPLAWTVIEDSGNQALLKLKDGVINVRDIGSSENEAPTIKINGKKNKFEPVQWKQGKWRLIAAERDNDQNIIALRHQNKKSIKIWGFDDKWILESKGKKIKVSSQKFLKQEQRFAQKLTPPLTEQDAPIPAPEPDTPPDPIPEPTPERKELPQSTWASNEPLFRYQWGLFNDGSLQGAKKNADTDAHEVFSTLLFPQQGITNEVDGRNVIAVIDTGVNVEHKDITGNLLVSDDVVDGIDNDGNGYIDDVFGYDFRNDDLGPLDDHGHGTHIAGIAAAEANGTGIVGANPAAKILPIKVMNDKGAGSTTNIIRGINYAVNKGAKVLNLSLGIDNPDPALKLALEQAQTSGALIVTAAGNDARNIDQIPQYPAGFDLENIITVASSDVDDSISSFSNTGANSVDLLAPGSSMFSAWIGSPTAIQGYEGTSMAAGMVSGAITAFWSRNPSFTPAQVKQRLLSTVDPLGVQQAVATGGRLNIARFMGLKADAPPISPNARTNDPLTRNKSNTTEATIGEKPSFGRHNLSNLPAALPDEVILFAQGRKPKQRQSAMAELNGLIREGGDGFQMIETLDVMSSLGNTLAILEFKAEQANNQRKELLNTLLELELARGFELPQTMEIA